MSPSRPFITRPVATSLLMAAILLAGIIAFRFLPLSALPEVDYPTIQVQTFYPGASPEVMAATVTAPLERQFGQMADLNRMSSISSGGDGVDQRPDTVRIQETNPQLKFHNAQRGYLVCTVTPDRWQTDFKVLDQVQDRRGTLTTRKSMVVEAGSARLQDA